MMSHVDEGTLHAYLDGALEAVCSEREAELVREHLASCPECAARLEEARQIRGDAMAVLATADPGPIEPPPLEDLREMAQARRKDGSSAGGTTSYLRQLAWAASIVVALGAGWSARQLSLPNAAFRPVPQGPAVGTEPSGDAVGNGSGVEAMAPDTMEPETPPLDAPARERGVEDDRPGPEGALPTTTPDSDAAAAAQKVAEESEDRSAEEAEQARADLAATEEPRRLEDRAPSVASGVAAEMGRAEMEAQAAAPAPSSFADEMGAGLDELGPRSMVIPGLEVLSVEVVQLPTDPTTGSGEMGTVVRQRLPGDEILVTFRLPVGMEPSALPILGDGMAQWVAPQGGGWLVLRAPIPPDSLRILGERLARGG
jgi:hypothetical protein